MNFVISSNVLAKKCQGLYTKICRKGEECYLKLNEDMFVEYIIRRNEDKKPPRWEMIEQNSSKIRAFHVSSESCEEILTNWTIFQGSNRRKGLIKFVIEENDVPSRGKKRCLDEIQAENKKKPKREFGRKVSQECKPLATRRKPTTNKRVQVHILENSPLASKSGKLLCDIETEDNELYVPEYVQDIICYLRSIECDFLPQRDYIPKKQPHMCKDSRTRLVDWMNAVVGKYEQTNATYHLSVNLFDRFMSRQTVRQQQVTLVCCVCLWLAAKYNEVHVPVMDDFITLTDSFDNEDMLAMECEIVNALDFHLTVPSTLNFAERYGHIVKHMLSLEKQRRRLIPLINFFIEHCALIYELVGEKPSLIAASASYAAAVWLDRDFEWTEQLVREIGYTVEEMQHIVAIIRHEIYEKKDFKKLKPHVFDKYKTRSNHYVSLMRYSASSTAV